MNLIFMRHGQATDNEKKIISDKEIYWSILTEEGIKKVKESINKLPNKIDKIYVSPLPRTIQTASLVHEKYSNVEVIIDKRLHEIEYGKYSGKENNQELDNVRLKQIDGDYFVRFGTYGENKYAIEERLCNFLKAVYLNNFKENTILIISHGSVISYMKRLLNIKTHHLKTGDIEIINDIDFTYLFNYMDKLKKIKNSKINDRLILLDKINISFKLKKNMERLIKNEFNNIEFPDSFFTNYFDGLTCKMKRLTNKKFDDNIILICFYQNFENIALKWMEHYINLGIKNFVLIDNNSTDNSTKILKRFNDKVNIDFWLYKGKYNCFKTCGLRQQILEFYGNHKYLFVDSDELLIYKNYQKNEIKKIVKNKKYLKSLMLDVYTKKPLFEGKLDDFKYIDKNTYKTSKTPYGLRYYGGPRSRIFNINPSLQKISFINYSGKELVLNDHYLYPWSINNRAKLNLYLLHYKFLPGDKEKYIKYISDERHWNNSSEYKIYLEKILNDKNLCFYDKDISILIDEFEV